MNALQSTADETVILSFPEQVELRVFVDYVGKALDVRFLTGDELGNQRVELRPTPIKLPKGRLLELLTGMLRVRGLAMVEELPGLYRIVRGDQTTRSVQAIISSDQAGQSADTSQSETVGPMRLVTQVLEVRSNDVKGISDRLAAFTTHAKGGLVAVPERGLILVTDYASRIAMLRELLALLDIGPRSIEVETIAVSNPETLSVQVGAMLTEQHRLSQTSGQPPAVRGDILAGSIVVVGTSSQIADAAALIERLTPAQADLTTRAYAARYLSVARAKNLIDNVVLAPGSGMTAPAAVYEDAQGGRLFVTAEPKTQEAIAAMFVREDHPQPSARRPLRIYRPRYRSAGLLLSTLSQLLGEGAELVTVDQPKDSASRASSSTSQGDSSNASQLAPAPGGQSDAELAPRAPLRVQGPDYVLTEDEHTNAILAIGPREFHAQLEQLIDDLDRRRPQVLIEMTLVAITMSDSLDLGVELEALDLGEASDFLLFTNFGLSTIDTATGLRTLTPAAGGNGILLQPDRVPIILRTLATHGRARVYSTPKLLVADNARATLRNVDEAPFTSVNASNTVATTSFAGFESAGTTLSLTPRISDGDHVTLEYELTFSNFTGSSSSGVPPPRTTNSFTSTVEVPDGYVVITGGLVVDNDSDSLSEIPWFGRVPVLGRLFQSTSRNRSKTKIFAFIRPTILRDDEFADLKQITLEDLEAAEVGRDSAPPGEPLWMR